MLEMVQPLCQQPKQPVICFLGSFTHAAFLFLFFFEILSLLGDVFEVYSMCRTNTCLRVSYNR